MKRQSRFTPPNPLEPKTVEMELADHGFNVQSVAGIRMFMDYLEHGERYTALPEDLFELEQHYMHQFPYCYLGRYVHILATAT